MRVISIPDHFAAEPITVLTLSRRAQNGLLAAGYTTLGDLNGKTLADLGGLRGVGADSLNEIADALGAVGELVPPPSTDKLAFPAGLSHWSTKCLGLPEMVVTALRNAGIATLADLEGFDAVHLSAIPRMGVAGVRAVFEGAKSLLALPNHEFVEVRSGRLQDPCAPLPMLAGLARAQSAEEELSALLIGLTERNAGLVRQRWARPRGRLATLESIAAEHGITRERVRQITEKHDQLLRNSAIKLRHLRRVAEVIDNSGGGVTTHHLMRLLSEAGVHIHPATLDFVQALGELGVIPKVVYVDQYRIWLTERGVAELLTSGKLAALTKSLRAIARRDLTVVGAVRISDLAPLSPFGARHALTLALRRETGIRRIGDYVIPSSALRSDLVTAVTKMLAVSPELSLDEISQGLSRMRLHKREGTIRVKVPPPDVLRAILAATGLFNVDNATVRPQTPSAVAGALNKSDRVLIAALEAHEGVATWEQLIEAVQQAGYSFATAQLLLAKPFVVRRAGAIYALRGRTISPHVLQERVHYRDQLQRKVVKSVAYTGGRIGKVVYEITTFVTQGVLPVPAKLSHIIHKRWMARFPDGRTQTLKVSASLLHPLRDWFERDHLKVGDVIVATYDIAEARIDFQIAS